MKGSRQDKKRQLQVENPKMRKHDQCGIKDTRVHHNGVFGRRVTVTVKLHLLKVQKCMHELILSGVVIIQEKYYIFRFLSFFCGFFILKQKGVQ